MRAEAKKIMTMLMEKRGEYSKVVNELDNNVRCGIVVNEELWAKERSITKELTKIRTKLMNVLPEFHFGVKNKFGKRNGFVEVNSARGDYGYLLCHECGFTFAATMDEDDSDIESFNDCVCHEGRKRVASFKVLLGGFGAMVDGGCYGV